MCPRHGVIFSLPLTCGDVGVHHGVNFNFDSAKVCSPAIFETFYDNDIWIPPIDYYMHFIYILTDNAIKISRSLYFYKDVWIVATDYYMRFI